MRATQHRNRSAQLIGAALAMLLMVGGCGGANPAEPGTATNGTAGPTQSLTRSPQPTVTRTTTPSRTTAATTTTSKTTQPPRPTTSTTTSITTTATTSTTAAPAPPPQCSVGALAGQDIERLTTNRRVVALTFDGGASNAGAQRILDTLSAEGVPATFFLTGRFAQTYPELSRAIGSRYPVGNHTRSHPDLTTLSRSAVVDEIRAGRADITRYAGVESRPLFRFPFGARSSMVIGLANDECYAAYRWTVDTLGWKGTSGGVTAQQVHDRVLGTLQPGQIVLMHLGANPQDGSTLDADALTQIIESIRAAGYDFVTLPR